MSTSKVTNRYCGNGRAPRKRRPLTPEQQQLILNSGRLVSHAVRLHTGGKPPLSPEEVRDLARYALCEAAAKYDPANGRSFALYAIGTIRSVIRDERRRRLRHNIRVDSDCDCAAVVDWRRSPVYRADVRLTVELIRTQLLTPGQWRLLMTVYSERESLDELAQRHGVTVSAVRKKVARIVERLRRRLDCAG